MAGLVPMETWHPRKTEYWTHLTDLPNQRGDVHDYSDLLTTVHRSGAVLKQTKSVTSQRWFERGKQDTAAGLAFPAGDLGGQAVQRTNTWHRRSWPPCGHSLLCLVLVQPPPGFTGTFPVEEHEWKSLQPGPLTDGAAELRSTWTRQCDEPRRLECGVRAALHEGSPGFALCPPPLSPPAWPLLLPEIFPASRACGGAKGAFCLLGMRDEPSPRLHSLKTPATGPP